MKKIMISQPMKGLTDKEIQVTRDKAMKWIADNGYEFQDSFVKEQAPTDTANISVWYLAKSIEFMSKTTAVYFCKGWETARGCMIEHTVASEYGLECIYEEIIDENVSVFEQLNELDDNDSQDDCYLVERQLSKKRALQVVDYVKQQLELINDENSNLPLTSAQLRSSAQFNPQAKFINQHSSRELIKAIKDNSNLKVTTIDSTLGAFIIENPELILV